MSNFALKASVLIAIDRRAGEWLTVEQIASHLGVSSERVRPICTELAAQAQLHQCLSDGQAVYGIQRGARE